MKKIINILFYLIAVNVYANTPNEHFIIYYQTGDHYEIQLTRETITWKGLEGNDKNVEETDFITRKFLTADVEVIQWLEKDQTFMTLIIDRAQFKVIASGKSQQGNWLNLGEVQYVF